jgi:hypothetical protein
VALFQDLTLEIDLRAEDVRAGLMRTVLRQTRFARLWPIWLGLAAGLLVVGLPTAVDGQTLPTPLFIFAAVLVLTLVVALLLLGRLGDRMFASLPSPHATWRFSARGVELRSGGGRTLLPWQGLQYEAREERVLLHPTPTTFHVLPWAGLSRTDQAQAMAWIEAHARPVPQPKRAWLPPLIALTLGVLTAVWWRTR